MKRGHERNEYLKTNLDGKALLLWNTCEANMDVASNRFGFERDMKKKVIGNYASMVKEPNQRRERSIKNRHWFLIVPAFGPLGVQLIRLVEQLL